MVKSILIYFRYYWTMFITVFSESILHNTNSCEDLMSFFNPRNTKDNIQDKFNEEIDNELLSFINTKLELYNKLTEDKVNLMFKQLWFNDLYDRKVRGIAAV